MSPSTAVPPLVLALDVGTSSCRAAVYDSQGTRLGHTAARRQYTPTLSSDGGAELDPEWLLERVSSCIDESLHDAGAEARRIGLVSTTAFWHSLVGVDADGRALTPVLLWMDARSKGELPALRRRLDEARVHARTGCVLHWSYLPAKLSWLYRERAALATRVRRWMSFGEYLVERLTGRACASVSMASASGLFDQHRCVWDDEVLAALPISRDQLPALEPRCLQVVGLSDASLRRWPTLAGVPWLTPIGDGATSNLGAGCTTRERLALMVGTSGALRVSWRAETFRIPTGLWCYRADTARVVMGGSLNDGGSLFSWLVGRLGLPPLEALEEQLAAMAPDAHGLTVLPLWGGERSPGWADGARGSIVGLGLTTTAVDICRAALEAISLRFASIESLLRAEVPEARSVVATGGGLLRSPAWLQIMADVLGRPVLASDVPEASSRGAALWALEATGQLPGGLESLPPPSGAVFEPRAAHTERYREARARQERLYAALVGSSRPPAREPKTEKR